ncbi:MAG TPA: serine/threonine-protein kinase, partial [Polyangiaceae bacterium]|nr:serine/threonine-protein kinase [Polyangiaceae bacterium]
MLNADAAAPDPMLGQVLGGKYTVIRLLGEGGMGAVYEGEQALGTTKRKVAVKTLHPHLSRDPKIKARFEREVGTIAELEHPNTIQVYDFGTTPDGILYIVMEFLQGKSLADQLEKNGPMDPARVENILQQVCGSLEEAHKRGIVHRDLKPDNVVLVERAGKKDFVKVLDFGIAKRSKEEDKEEQKLTQQGMVLGTPPYMSPEQFTGRPIDSRSDIYSLGVMTYEMLSGKLPFKADTAWEWATQHMTQPPIPIESLAEGQRTTEAMRAALRKALAKAPDDRFQTVAEFCDAFCGKGAVGTVAAAPQGKARTEIGTPLDVNAAFGPQAGMGGGMGAPMGGPPGPMQGYTPVGGNVAFPTPAGIPQAPGIPMPPPREGKGGGGNRGPLLIVAGLIGLA